MQSFNSYSDAAKANVVELPRLSPKNVQSPTHRPQKRVETKLLPVLRSNVNKPGYVCEMCGKHLLTICDRCKNIPANQERTRCDHDIVVTELCGHFYHKSCIFGWLSHESYCVGGIGKRQECMMEIDA